MKSRGTISLYSRTHLPPACCAQVRQKLFGKNRAVYLRARLTESRRDSTEPEGQARARLDIPGKRVHLRLGSWGDLQAPPAASPAQGPGSGGSPPKMGRGRDLPRARLPSSSAPGLCLQPQAGSLPRLRYRASLVCLWLPQSTEPVACLLHARSRSWHATHVQVQEVRGKPLRSTEQSRNLSRVQGPCHKPGSPEDCNAG